MNTANQIRSVDVFTDYEDLQFDRILKRLPADLSETTVEKYNAEETLNIMFGIKTIIAFGATNTGKKLLKIVITRFKNLTEKDLLGAYKKELIILLGIMHDVHMSDEIYNFVTFLGDNLTLKLQSDQSFKFLWAMVLTEIKNPKNHQAMMLFKDLQTEKTLPAPSRDFSRIKFLKLMLDKKLITPEEAIEACELMEKGLTSESPVYLCELKAHAYHAQGEEQKARDNASRLLKLLNSNLVKLNFQTRQLLVSLDKNSAQAIKVDNHILLKLYPRLEKRLSLKTLKENENEELFVIKNDEMRITRYGQIEHDKKDSVLDLVSGFYCFKNRKLFLSKNRTLAIKAIISMGPIGIKDILIGEYVFRDENISFNSIRKRSQDLVTQLQKIEIPIIRKDNTIYYDFDNSPLTVIVGVDEYRGEIAYLKNKHSIINKKIVTYELMTKPSTSSLYLKQWREENKIIPTNDPYGDYRFN